MNILLTCVGRRHYLASYFSSAINGGKVIGADMDLSAPALQACDVAKLVPNVFDPNYIDALIEVILDEKIDMVFSLNDLEVGLLVQHREKIERETGAAVYVPSIDTLKVCADKWRTFQYAREIGVNTPETYLTVFDAVAALNSGSMSFPLIVKPRWGSASLGLYEVNSVHELKESFEACLSTVSKSTLASLSAESAVIIQELIEGPEYGVDILFGLKENFIGFTAKKKLGMRAGETDKAVTVASEPFTEIVANIAQTLEHRGNMDCDFLERDGNFYLLEFNPRFGGGYPFTHLAGSNHIQMLLDDHQGKELEKYGYDTGKGFAKFDTLVEVPVDSK